MILAEKIMSLRKRLGWSQEELAHRLGVSRQSVSKWESSSSIPDVTKIVQMSELFDVSVDYLLKDNPEDEQNMPFASFEAEAVTSGEGATGESEQGFAHDAIPIAHQVSLDEANAYTNLVEQLSPAMALAVALCVWSPIALFSLAPLSEGGILSLSEDVSIAISLGILLVVIAIAVFIFIAKGSQLRSYEYLEQDDIELQYGVEAAIHRKQEAFEGAYRLSVGIGVVLILVGIIPVVTMTLVFDDSPLAELSVPLLLVFVGVAVFLFVRFGMVKSSFQKLLQVEDYSRESKELNRKLGWFPGVYWCAVTALYLGVSILGNRWDVSWGIWPIAGVLFAAVYGVMRARVQRGNR